MATGMGYIDFCGSEQSNNSDTRGGNTLDLWRFRGGKDINVLCFSQPFLKTSLWRKKGKYPGAALLNCCKHVKFYWLLNLLSPFRWLWSGFAIPLIFSYRSIRNSRGWPYLCTFHAKKPIKTLWCLPNPISFTQRICGADDGQLNFGLDRWYGLSSFIPSKNKY